MEKKKSLYAIKKKKESNGTNFLILIPISYKFSLLRNLILVFFYMKSTNTTLCRLSLFRESLQSVTHVRTYTIKIYSTLAVSNTFEFGGGKAFCQETEICLSWAVDFLIKLSVHVHEQAQYYILPIVLIVSLCQGLHYGKPSSGYFLPLLLLVSFLIAF